MAKAKQATVEDKLIALYKLQTIDTQIDNIKILRGELPLEVQDLEDEIAGLQTRLGYLLPQSLNHSQRLTLGCLSNYQRLSCLNVRFALLHR